MADRPKSGVFGHMAIGSTSGRSAIESSELAVSCMNYRIEFELQIRLKTVYSVICLSGAWLEGGPYIELAGSCMNRCIEFEWQTLLKTVYSVIWLSGARLEGE